MEIQPSSAQLIAKKLWNIGRVVLYMLKKGIANSKLMQELNLMCIQRGKLAGKAFNDLVLHLQQDYTHSLTCRSADVSSSVISRREYEFSCSNSPAYPAHIFSKRRTHNHHQYYRPNHHHHHHKPKDIQFVQKMFDNLNSYERFEAASPSAAPLPGFGQSPMVVRQLRVTDSPYPLKDHEEGNHQVDKDAEDFINRFYRDLKMQRRVAAVDSPSPYHYSSSWGR